MDIRAVTGDQLAEKLDSLGMKNSRPASEGSFDYIEEKADTMDTPINPTLSINTTEEWEKQLLKDPKVSLSPNAFHSFMLIQTSCRIDLHSLLLYNTATTSSPSVQPRSRIYRGLMSNYRLRGDLSPIKGLLAAAGSLPPQTSSE